MKDLVPKHSHIGSRTRTYKFGKKANLVHKSRLEKKTTFELIFATSFAVTVGWEIAWNFQFKLLPCFGLWKLLASLILQGFKLPYSHFVLQLEAEIIAFSGITFPLSLFAPWPILR